MGASREGLVQVPIEAIAYISAEGNYVMLHLADTTHLMKDTITSL